MATDEKLGSVVAFEGHAETISTQLRLLPTSPQLLILPSVECYISKSDMDDEFDTRTFIKKMHTAALARQQAAQEFLRGSTPNSKRLVLMNGGTPGAQALCIKAIMEHKTGGDFAHAEAIFNNLVKEGVAGLDGFAADRSRRHTFGLDNEEEYEEGLEDPITRAMRAADALDRQTASLQTTNELDLTLAARPRRSSLPLYGYVDNFGDAAPFFVFGAQEQEEAESIFAETYDGGPSPYTPKFTLTHHDQPLTGLYSGYTHLQPPSPGTPIPRSPSCTGETYGMAVPSSLCPDLFTPRSDVFSIHSTDNIVYGEASLLDMRHAGRRATLTRVKSLDRIYLTTPRYRDLCIPPSPTEPGRQHNKDMEQKLSPGIQRHSFTVVVSAKDSQSDSFSYAERPRTIVVRSTRPIIKVAPVPSKKKRKPARASYIDRGTDAQSNCEPKKPFEPVLNFCEDLVVHFKDEVPETLLDSIMKGFRTGHYPVACHSPTTPEVDQVNTPSPETPKLQSIHDPRCINEEIREPAVVIRSSYTGEYDPFAYAQPIWPQIKPLQKVPRLQIEQQQTPASRLTLPAASEGNKKIHEFRINGQQTAVTVQNCLRSMLKDHFPPESQGYRQFRFPLLPELEGLWRPVFSQTDPESPRKDGRPVDHILAIGAQRGVMKDYASAITGRLEKLGTKSNGMSRSGRLDFRYLLANAMQAYTAQPLTSQMHENPFANSYLLATLIVPHLETYLALHGEVRFLLLEYPPEHLPTMLALQKLVGVGMMKVAQIVDSNSRDDLPFTHISGKASITKPEQGLTGRSGASHSPSSGSCHDVTVSKANFLLTSTASEAEIETFILTVLKILSRISSFYAPEVLTKKPSPKKSKPPMLQGTFSAFPRVPSGPQSPPMTPAFTARPNAGALLSSSRSSRAPSIAETVKTARSTKSRRSRVEPRRKPWASDAQSTLTVDIDDSDWDMEDRRVMPILMQKEDARYGNTRKALKFLGLA